MDQRRTALITAIVATVLAWAVWWLTIIRTNPETIGWIGYVLFYAILFLAVAGSGTIIGLGIRLHSSRRDHALSAAVRQGALIGAAIAIASFLQSRELLTWMNMIFLVFALSLLELFIMSLRGRARAESASQFGPIVE